MTPYTRQKFLAALQIAVLSFSLPLPLTSNSWAQASIVGEMALKNENLKEANEPKHCWRASEPLLTISAGSAGSDTSQVVDEAEIASLIEKLKNDDEREQWNIVNALQRIGSQAIPTLIKALDLSEI
jgi:hypothetical protein